MASKRIAALSRRWEPEDAFIAGLVFRIDQLVLATALPAEHELGSQECSKETGTLEAQERPAAEEHLACNKAVFYLSFRGAIAANVWISLNAE